MSKVDSQTPFAPPAVPAAFDKPWARVGGAMETY